MLIPGKSALAFLAASLLLLIASRLPGDESSSGAVSAEKQAAKWLAELQDWRRDTSGPILSLGEPGQFDDTHLFAPAVVRDGGRFLLWYCGSTGRVAERVFQMGLATSEDGRRFRRKPENPVYRFGDGRHSILTPTLLRNPDGSVLREDGQLRMWFSSTWFAGDSGLHTLHETSSADGVQWSPPSEAQLEHIYAPTILKEEEGYRMWYTDVSHEPWIIRHASSEDGRQWSVSEQPCLVVDQPWEQSRLFYPAVVRRDNVYLMWYGSYWKARRHTTALGFAVSSDGFTWRKHPRNPVFRPDEERPWESHYVTSQSMLEVADGRFRVWYASRKKPPFRNKYFALNTAVWDLPPTLTPAPTRRRSKR